MAVIQVYPSGVKEARMYVQNVLLFNRNLTIFVLHNAHTFNNPSKTKWYHYCTVSGGCSW